MQEVVINLYPIIKYGITIIGFIVLLFIFYCLVYKQLRNNKEIIEIKENSNTINNLINKFPLVNADFINKNVKEQNIENNQEIHELHKRITYIEQQIEKLSEELTKWKDT